MKKHLFLSVVVLFALVLVSCAPAAAPAEEAPAAEVVVEEVVSGEPEVCASDAYGCAVIEPGQTVKIGMSSPMTGGYADFGIDAENSGLLAVADAGDFEGWSFELMAEDDEGGAEGGAAVANKLTADPTVVGMAGPLFSGATAAGIPIYDAAGIPMLSPSATNPPLTAMGSAVFNRVPFTDDAQGSAAANYMFNTLGFTKIAVLHDGETYGKGLATIAKSEFEALGGEVVVFEGITVGEADYTPILTTISASAPEAIYFGGYSAEGAVLTNQMKALGLEDAVFFGCDGTFGADYLSLTGDNGEGSYHAKPKDPPASDAKGKFDADYLAAYGIAPVVLSPFSYNSYDCTTVLITKVKEAAVVGGDGNLYIPRGAVVDAVRGLTNYTGISGTYTCDEIGECNVEGPQFMTIVDGAFAYAE
ncbi:MAG: branched-chain amino acid ABC transporter substrate-binding protein [Pelolinea sp.]|nr:branched-chain amino acid ABC transporter substrate-binding protein [Pelolinea sp.]